MIDWIKRAFDTSVDDQSPLDSEIRSLLLLSLREMESLYRAAARISAVDCRELITGDPQKWLSVMIDLHRGLLVKILIEIGSCDRQWEPAECEVVKLVLRHAWGTGVGDDALAQTIRNVSDHAETLRWESLVEPFTRMPPLADQRPDLTALALRIANLIAKADGTVQPAEVHALKTIERELEAALDQPDQGVHRSNHSTSNSSTPNTRRVGVQSSDPTAGQPVAVARRRDGNHPERDSESSESQPPLSRQERQRGFDEAMNELDQLTGLDPVKKDIRELVDFLRIQAQRKEHGLAAAQVSLHTVFEGNPGTGKTTVARILGRILCGLNLLDRGHTVETDRSGLVAEYAGQTGPRTQQRIDEALDGVLFIDEAYSLISEDGQDAFGVEAIQTLLKRMEDDRERLTVVLAGYPEPMSQLMRSNPGLSSRFQRTFKFPDYSALELLEIFRTIGKKNHYRMTGDAKRKLHAGFQQLIEQKDDHFGNGRLARNIFEQSIRRQATRIVGVAPLTRELLTTLEPEDIQIAGASRHA